MRKSDHGILNPFQSHRFRVPDCDRYDGIRIFSYRETPFRQARRIISKNIFLDSLDYQDVEAKIIYKAFWIKTSTRRVGLLIEVLLGEIKPVVLLKFVFECRQKFKKRTRFWGLSRFRCKNQITIIRVDSNSKSAKQPILTLMREIKTIVTVKHHFDYRDIFFSLNNSLEILGCHDFHARIKIHSLSIKNYRRRRGSELRTETFVEEIRRLVTVKIDVEYQQKSKKLKKSISGRVPVYDGTTQVTKIWIESFSLNVMLLLLTLLKWIIPIVTEKQPFDYRNESFLKTVFWKFWIIKILMQESVSRVLQSKPLLQK